MKCYPIKFPIINKLVNRFNFSLNKLFLVISYKIIIFESIESVPIRIRTAEPPYNRSIPYSSVKQKTGSRFAEYFKQKSKFKKVDVSHTNICLVTCKKYERSSFFNFRRMHYLAFWQFCFRRRELLNLPLNSPLSLSSRVYASSQFSQFNLQFH